jgi:hypothetical protein
VTDLAGAFEEQRGRLFGLAYRPEEVNGEPALVARAGGAPFGVIVLEIADGRIAAVRAVANPGKLGFAARQAASGRASPWQIRSW